MADINKIINSPSSQFKNTSFQSSNINNNIKNLSINNIDNNRIPPVKKLTVLLIKTYREVNQVFKLIIFINLYLEIL